MVCLRLAFIMLCSK
uniref:Uncharacterized protein n=1 Tax=Arundo donax TaxID=35708 RepID=A0A0A8YTH8_ARUDO